MPSVAGIFDAFDGPAAVGRAIGVTTEHAASMRRRGSIPVGYWPDLLSEGGKHEPPIVTHQDLIEAHASRRPVRRHPVAVEARP